MERPASRQYGSAQLPLGRFAGNIPWEVRHDGYGGDALVPGGDSLVDPLLQLFGVRGSGRYWSGGHCSVLC